MENAVQKDKSTNSISVLMPVSVFFASIYTISALLGTAYLFYIILNGSISNVVIEGSPEGLSGYSAILYMCSQFISNWLIAFSFILISKFFARINTYKDMFSDTRIMLLEKAIYLRIGAWVVVLFTEILRMYYSTTVGQDANAEIEFGSLAVSIMLLLVAKAFRDAARLRDFEKLTI